MNIVTEISAIQEIIDFAKKQHLSLWKWGELIRQDRRVLFVINSNKVHAAWDHPIKPDDFYIGASSNSVNVYQCKGLDKFGRVYAKHSSIILNFNQCVLVVKPGTKLPSINKSTEVNISVKQDINAEKIKIAKYTKESKSSDKLQENCWTNQNSKPRTIKVIRFPEQAATSEQIAKLPKEYREIVELYLKGVKRKKVAEILNIPLSTVKHKIQSARILLQGKK